jgi:hypothetical protein
VSKFRGQVTVDETEVNEENEENNDSSRLRRIQSLSSGSPLIGKKSISVRRKSQTNQKSVTIKTSTSSVPTPSLNRNNGVSSSSSNDVILHVGGNAWTRESLAYGASRDNTRPNSAQGSSSNKLYRKSSVISSTSIINHQIPSLRPATTESPATRTKVAGEYVQSKTADLSFTTQEDFQSIKFLDEQEEKNDGKNVVNVELVQNAFKEYKKDINQSLSELDTKMSRLESMIKLLVERMPVVVVPQVDANVASTERKNTPSERINES